MCTDMHASPFSVSVSRHRDESTALSFATTRRRAHFSRPDRLSELTIKRIIIITINVFTTEILNRQVFRFPYVVLANDDHKFLLSIPYRLSCRDSRVSLRNSFPSFFFFFSFFASSTRSPTRIRPRLTGNRRWRWQRSFVSDLPWPFNSWELKVSAEGKSRVQNTRLTLASHRRSARSPDQSVEDEENKNRRPTLHHRQQPYLRARPRNKKVSPYADDYVRRFSRNVCSTEKWPKKGSNETFLLDKYQEWIECTSRSFLSTSHDKINEVETD